MIGCWRCDDDSRQRRSRLTGRVVDVAVVAVVIGGLDVSRARIADTHGETIAGIVAEQTILRIRWVV